jgi:hypothetical protein
VSDAIDTLTAAGRFFFHMLAALAGMKRDLIRERTQAGLKFAPWRCRLCASGMATLAQPCGFNGFNRVLVCRILLAS